MYAENQSYILLLYAMKTNKNAMFSVCTLHNIFAFFVEKAD